jgi:hypothetical protein
VQTCVEAYAASGTLETTVTSTIRATVAPDGHWQTIRRVGLLAFGQVLPQLPRVAGARRTAS